MLGTRARIGATLALCACGSGGPHPEPAPSDCRRVSAVSDPARPTEPAVLARHPIRVSTFDAGVAGDGLCSLGEALAAANAPGAPSEGDCAAGTGNDVIELGAGVYRAEGPLELAESVEIRGEGMERSTLSFSDTPPGCAVRLETVGISARLTSLTLDGASSTSELTGVCVHAGTLRVRHARVTGFSAGGLVARALSGENARLEVIDSLVDENHNTSDGGGVANVDPGSSLWVAESAIVNNTSEGFGGGIFGSGGSNADYISNTTISGNVARAGGGVAGRVRAGLYLGLYWSTITDNRASVTGGGIHVEGEDASHTLFVGNLVTGNAADANGAEANLNADWGTNFLCTGSLLFARELERLPDVFPPGSCFFDVADAGLGPLMDMGGRNHLPMHALLPNSPAIDAIDEENSFNPTEQRNTWNESAGDAPLGTGQGDTPAWSVFGRGRDGDVLADMGAFERNPRWEAELLTVAELRAADHAVDASTQAASHGAGTHLAGCGAGDYVVYEVPVPESGPYAVSARLRTSESAGQFVLAASDALEGPYVTIGSPEDTYSARGDFRTFELGNVEFSTAGKKFFKLTVARKNDASTGFDLFPDYFEVKKP
jgi:hypothetical protein